MASFLELIDNTLGTHFAAPVYDPKKGRAKFVKVIDNAAEQHKEGKTPPTRSWKLGNNDAISFEPKLNGNPVVIGSSHINYVPAERFQDFLKGLKAEVEKGTLDDEIKAALEGTGSKPPKATASGGTREVGAQSKLNIGVAGKRVRGKQSFEDIRKHYIDAGADPALVDIAIDKRKAAEKNAK